MNAIYSELSIFLVSLILFLALVAITVKYSIKLGQVFGIGNFSMSFILLAFASSIPELVIAFVSSANELGELGVGVALGSTIINLTLITGMIALFTRSLNSNNQYKLRQALLLGFLGSVAILTLLDGELTRFDGFILITGYFVYLYELWFSQAREVDKKIKIHYTEFLSIATVLIFTILSMLFISDVLVDSTAKLSDKLGITPLVIGVLMISAVTAIPELLVEFKNVRSNKERMSLGDLIGAVGTNSSLIIGLIAIITPLTIAINSVMLIIFFFYVVSIIMFLTFLYTRKAIDWFEGIILILIYLSFLFAVFLSSLIV